MSIDKSSVKGENQNRRQLRRQTVKEAKDKTYGQYLEND